jgi:hypothetical protein
MRGREQQTEKVVSCGYCKEWARKNHCTKRVLGLVKFAFFCFVTWYFVPLKIRNLRTVTNFITTNPLNSTTDASTQRVPYFSFIAQKKNEGSQIPLDKKRHCFNELYFEA